jgi:hypothetical protein
MDPYLEGALRTTVHFSLSAGLLHPPYRAIQCAEAKVAVGLERAHAQLVGQGEGLSAACSARMRSAR